MQKIVEVNTKLIEKNKKKYEGVYAKNGKIAVSVFYPGQFNVTQVQALENKEDDLLSRLDGYNQAAQAVLDGFDNVPCATFGFGSVAYLMALAYGGGCAEP